MVNEPLRDFAQAAIRESFARAVASANVPAVRDASNAEEARHAIARAAAAFPAWRDFDPLERSRIIVQAAALMRDRRDDLAAIMIREAGKPWREADADVCEAIDFCEYYARQAVGLFRPQQLGRFVAELNHQWYQARGVAAIISPWNFPLSICCGMTTAALAVGNTAIVKPSTQTRGIAQAMCEILWQAGVPADVLHFLPGSGRAIGDVLVRDPHVAIIAFTGSKEVGLGILRAAGDTPEGQSFVKKVVCEMGGKNAIIVDDSADLDEAVLGVRQSAFGYCGQKCSACSRVIVLEGVFDQFLKRLVESTRTLVIGDPADPGTDLGPVIDQSCRREDPPIHRDRQERRPPGTGLRSARGTGRSRRQALYRAAHLLEHPAAPSFGQRRDFRAGAVGDARGQFCRGPGSGQLDGVQADRGRLQPEAVASGGRAARVSRGQPLSQPRHHRGDGGPAAVRRIRALRHRQQGRRRRLSPPLRRAPLLHREYHASRLCAGAGMFLTLRRTHYSPSSAKTKTPDPVLFGTTIVHFQRYLMA